jgi:hypothetical protein
MIEAALQWLENGYWPIPISPLVTGGKKPLGGADWGKYPSTPETLHILYATHPGAGLGLLLGDQPCVGGPIFLLTCRCTWR